MYCSDVQWRVPSRRPSASRASARWIIPTDGVTHMRPASLRSIWISRLASPDLRVGGLRHDDGHQLDGEMLVLSLAELLQPVDLAADDDGDGLGDWVAEVAPAFLVVLPAVVLALLVELRVVVVEQVTKTLQLLGRVAGELG